MKKVLTLIYIIIVLGFLAFPAYIHKLEPQQLNSNRDYVERSYIWGSYGYVRMLSMLVIVSVLYWIIATVVLGKPEEE